MKRKIISVMAVCLCLSIMISGCSKKEETSYPASNIVEPSMRNSSAGENASSPNKLSSKAVTPPASDFEYELSDDMEGVVIKKYKGTETAIKIPAEIEDIPVTELSNYGFWKTNHTYIEIPNSVKKIGDYCFSDCSSLEAVIIPDSVTEIGGAAFNDCTSLESISIPKSVVKMGSIFGRSGLRSVVIPNSITDDFGEQFTLPTGMFSGSKNLTSIQLPNDLKIIPMYFAADCESLTNITIPNTVTKIDDNAFEGCRSLTQIDFPESLEILSTSALRYTGLKSLCIPDSVTLKGDFSSGYGDAYGFEEIRLPDNMKDMSEMDFSGCRASLVKINLPASLEVLGGAEANVFLGCKNLKELVIPDELEKVEFGDFTFVGCSSLSLATQKRLKQLGYKGTF